MLSAGAVTGWWKSTVTLRGRAESISWWVWLNLSSSRMCTLSNNNHLLDMKCYSQIFQFRITNVRRLWRGWRSVRSHQSIRNYWLTTLCIICKNWIMKLQKRVKEAQQKYKLLCSLLNALMKGSTFVRDHLKVCINAKSNSIMSKVNVNCVRWIFILKP